MAHCEFGYADHKRIPVGTKVEYKLVNGAMLKGVIVDDKKDVHRMFPGFQMMRVTSRNNPAYKHGDIIEISVNYTTIRK